MECYMNSYVITALSCLLAAGSINCQAQETQRIEQFSNSNVTVWKTIIYPTVKQTLGMHRHEHDRVLVALTDGELKITNNKGAIH
jgi:hypothetical protein